MTTTEPRTHLLCVCGRPLDEIEWRIYGPALMADESPRALPGSFSPTGLIYRCECLLSVHVDIVEVLRAAEQARQEGREWVEAYTW
jgi:hypothetical protein